MRDAAPATAGGLDPAEARARLRRDGPNELPRPPAPSPLRRFAHQLVHFFALMLWAASALALLGGLPQLSVAIAVIVVLNAAFAFVQERRADRAAERLRALLPRKVVVRRGGRRVDVDSTEVVVDDVVLLGPGDRVPVDAVVFVAHGVRVDTSLLTGESEPVDVTVDDVLLAGTFLVEGDAEATATATGGQTRLAGIARLTTATTSPPSPLARELHGVVRTIGLIAVGVGVAFFALALLLGDPPSDGFVFAIGVTVALVPEGLLPTVTLALAWGSERMAHRQVLVRNLDAVETLGSTTFICTDKTGTITSNRMTVVEAWVPGATATLSTAGWDPDAPVEVHARSAGAHAELARLATVATHCSFGHAVLLDGEWQPHGDPMEVAIDVFARRLGIDTDALRATGAPLARFAFDPRRRRMSVVLGDELLCKGAPDTVLPLCAADHGATEVLATLTRRGLRVLAVAARPVSGVPQRWEDAERELELLGLVALEDPPRDGVREAVQACRVAGIRVGMITGDHPDTAGAIAAEAGLRGPGDPVLLGAQLPADDAELGELLDRDGLVVARVSPEQKLRIARALRARGHVVAMTGDGVNDGPALNEADIGIAMGASGTDVAREAADLVLLDDHFASIVAGVEQGRATFLNVRRFLTYHLTDNVAELTPFVVWALSGGNVPLALGVLQILALDIGTDTFSAAALGAEPPRADVLERPPVSGRLLDRRVLGRAFGVLGPTVAVCTMTAFFASFWAVGWRPGESFDTRWVPVASGAAFMTVVLSQVANAFACRSSSRWPGALGWTTNRLLLVAVVISVALSLLLLVVPLIAEQLGHEWPSTPGWVVAVGAMPVLLGVDAAHKALRRARRARRRVGGDPQRGGRPS